MKKKNSVIKTVPAQTDRFSSVSLPRHFKGMSSYRTDLVPITGETAGLSEDRTGLSLRYQYIFVEDGHIGRDIEHLDIHGIPGPQVFPARTKNRSYTINKGGIRVFV